VSRSGAAAGARAAASPRRRARHGQPGPVRPTSRRKTATSRPYPGKETAEVHDDHDVGTGVLAATLDMTDRL